MGAFLVLVFIVAFAGLLAFSVVIRLKYLKLTADLREACRLLMLERLDKVSSDSDTWRRVNLLAQNATLDEVVTHALHNVPKGAVRDESS